MTERKAHSLLFYVDGLRSRRCVCGRNKLRGGSFCFRCYTRLSKVHRNALYARLGQGYEAAYDAAVEVLGAA